jgi:hypothetical protein
MAMTTLGYDYKRRGDGAKPTPPATKMIYA